jgi:hypothetical protein
MKKKLIIGLLAAVVLVAAGWRARSYLDDAAIGIGTARILPVGFLCDSTSTDSVDEGDLGLARITPDRRVIVANEADGKTLVYESFNETLDGAGTPVSIISAVAAKKIYVVAMSLTVDTQCTIGFVEDVGGDDTALSDGASGNAPIFQLAAYGGIYLPKENYHIATKTVNEDFGIDDLDAGAVQVTGHIWYYTE